MKTCRECAHYTPCWKATSVTMKQHAERAEIVDYCADFLDRCHMIALPIGFGEVVYVIEARQVREARVVDVTISVTEDLVKIEYVAESEGGHRFFDDSDIGDAVFLTRESADAALAIRNEKQTQAR